MAVSQENAFTYYHSAVLIDTTNVTRGQSIADFRVTLTPELFDGRPKHKIAINLNYEWFYKKFMSVMTGEQF